MVFDSKEKLVEKDIERLNTWKQGNEFIELDWFKLLTGFIDLEYEEQTISQNKNFCVLGIKEYTEDFTIEEFNTFLSPEISLQYFKNNRTNNKLYKVLYNELALYFIAQKKGSNIEAFVHLYRIIEKMSIMFPLVYFKQSSNFEKVFESVKDLLTKDTNGLKFFKNFQKTLFKDHYFYEDKVTFTFFISSESEKSELKYIFDSIIRKELAGAELVEDNKIVIFFRNLVDLAVTIRNRYFHLSIQQDYNIEAVELNMNDFFGSINNNILNWIGVIYYEIFKILNP